MLAWLLDRVHRGAHARRLPVANRLERRRLEALQRHQAGRRRPSR